MNRLKLIAYGVTVAVLYGLLFFYEKEAIRLCQQGGWYFLFPVTVAFVFSLFHGTFTGMFWDALGVKARTSSKK
ncbi:MAG: hypothetical protein OEW36_05375 [Hylemonella sp.]|nr:hypothetical protein [Hylemonella sp.]